MKSEIKRGNVSRLMEHNKILLSSLRTVLRRNGIPGSEYSVNGYAEQRVCLEPTEVGWEVYIGERGQKFDLTTHRALDDACKQMFVELADSVSLRDRMIFEFTRHVALKKRNAARKADTMKGYSKKSQV